MRLPNERCVIPCAAQGVSDGWIILWQRDAIHPHAMRSHMLASDDARPGWHTHHVVIVRALKIDAFGRERIDAGRSCHLAPVTAKGIKPHLIGGNEQYISSFFGHPLPH